MFNVEPLYESNLDTFVFKLNQSNFIFNDVLLYTAFSPKLLSGF